MDAKLILNQDIASLIQTIRGHRVMLDSDLAKIYRVTTKQLNQQLRRNRDRFPEDFAFKLTEKEFDQMRSQFVTASKRNIRHRPMVFTEHGAIMLASVLNSRVAVAASVGVVRAFVRLREMAITHKELAKKLDDPEARVNGHDKSLQHVFAALRQIMAPPTRLIGFQIKPQPKPSEGPLAS